MDRPRLVLPVKGVPGGVILHVHGVCTCTWCWLR